MYDLITLLQRLVCFACAVLAAVAAVHAFTTTPSRAAVELGKALLFLAMAWIARGYSVWDAAEDSLRRDALLLGIALTAVLLAQFTG